jgi:predicted enzyme related to lactoylglutathione lyase
MPTVAKHPPGAFCWIELGTTDQNAAKKFYGTLFGWESKDLPMGPNDAYTMFKLKGRDAGAGHAVRPDRRAVGRMAVISDPQGAVCAIFQAMPRQS